MSNKSAFEIKNPLIIAKTKNYTSTLRDIE